jgi:hypothetical protein
MHSHRAGMGNMDGAEQRRGAVEGQGGMRRRGTYRVVIFHRKERK